MKLWGAHHGERGQCLKPPLLTNSSSPLRSSTSVKRPSMATPRIQHPEFAKSGICAESRRIVTTITVRFESETEPVRRVLIRARLSNVREPFAIVNGLTAFQPGAPEKAGRVPATIQFHRRSFGRRSSLRHGHHGRAACVGLWSDLEANVLGSAPLPENSTPTLFTWFRLCGRSLTRSVAPISYR